MSAPLNPGFPTCVLHPMIPPLKTNFAAERPAYYSLTTLMPAYRMRMVVPWALHWLLQLIVGRGPLVGHCHRTNCDGVWLQRCYAYVHRYYGDCGGRGFDGDGGGVDTGRHFYRDHILCILKGNKPNVNISCKYIYI